MSFASLLKQRTRKTVTLRQTDDAGQPITVVIKKISAGEITARIGAPWGLLQAAADVMSGERAEREAASRELIARDPEAFAEAVQYGARKKAAVVCLGVVSEKVVDKPEHELAEDEMRPEHFREDFELLYNEIVTFSGLPYNSLEVRDLATFRSEQERPAGASLS